MGTEAKRQSAVSKSEVTQLRTECKRLDELKFRHEKEINEHLITLSALKQQLSDKGEIAENNTSLLQSERSQRMAMAEQVRLHRANAEKADKKMKECIKEINKGNAIISHLQNEIRNQRNKNKLKEQKLSESQKA